MLERLLHQKTLFWNYYITYLPMTLVLYAILVFCLFLDEICDALKNAHKDCRYHLSVFTKKHFDAERPWIYREETITNDE